MCLEREEIYKNDRDTPKVVVFRKSELVDFPSEVHYTLCNVYTDCIQYNILIRCTL